MTTIAIIGAGPGLGAAVARRFGAEGFSAALISRSQDHADALAQQLSEEGITALGFAADARDPDDLALTLEAVTETMGPIEVLQYSPLPQKDFMRPVLETTVDDLVGPIEFSIYGPVAAVHQVLPGMRHLRSDRASILFINGGTSLVPRPHLAGTSIAFAGETAYATMLREVLEPEHINVCQIVIGGSIEPGHPEKDPARLAEVIWEMHDRRDRFRVEVATG